MARRNSEEGWKGKMVTIAWIDREKRRLPAMEGSDDKDRNARFDGDNKGAMKRSGVGGQWQGATVSLGTLPIRLFLLFFQLENSILYRAANGFLSQGQSSAHVTNR